MAKRGNRLREFEKNNRVLDISSKQEARRKKRRTERRKDQENVEVKEEIKKEEKINWKKIVPRVLIIIFIIMMIGTLNNIRTLKEREKELQEKNIQLSQIKEELEVEIKNVNSPDYIESIARKDLKLAKSNELIFYFDESKDAKEKTEDE